MVSMLPKSHMGTSPPRIVRQCPAPGRRFGGGSRARSPARGLEAKPRVWAISVGSLRCGFSQRQASRLSNG